MPPLMWDMFWIGVLSAERSLHLSPFVAIVDKKCSFILYISITETASRQSLYTRGGDKGETSLYGASRVPKDSPRVDAYGTIDELNSCIGAAIADCRHEEV